MRTPTTVPVVHGQAKKRNPSVPPNTSRLNTSIQRDLAYNVRANSTALNWAAIVDVEAELADPQREEKTTSMT
jgi:hypothetical protein